MLGGSSSTSFSNFEHPAMIKITVSARLCILRLLRNAPLAFDGTRCSRHGLIVSKKILLKEGGIVSSGVEVRLAHLFGIFKLLNSHVRVDPEKTIESLPDREEIMIALNIVYLILVGKMLKRDLEQDPASM